MGTMKDLQIERMNLEKDKVAIYIKLNDLELDKSELLSHLDVIKKRLDELNSLVFTI